MLSTPIVWLTLFRDTCWMLYAGVIIAFALTTIRPVDHREFLNAFRAMGVVLGLSFGGTILSSIAITWIQRGSFFPETTIEAVGWGVGLLLWISNIVLEIWTLDPIRKHALGILPPERDIQALERKTLTHVRLHAGLCLMTHVLCWLAERS